MRAPVFAVLVLATGCGPTAEAFCDLDSTPPPESEVAAGEGKAQRDGADFAGDATYSTTANASLTIGLLDMLIAADTTGTSVIELVDRGAFPICVEFGGRDEDTMTAQLLEGDTQPTTGSDAGRLSIVAAEGDTLVGRFEVDVGGSSFTDGVFRATKR
jgi:hypothetical protein